MLALERSCLKMNMKMIDDDDDDLDDDNVYDHRNHDNEDNL